MPNITNKIFTWIYSFVTTSYALYMLIQKEYAQSLQGILMTFAFLLATYRYYNLFEKNYILFHTNAFLFTAAYLGLVLRFYRKIPYYDLAIHFYAGIILIWYGYLFYSKLKDHHIELYNPLLLCIIIFFFSVTVQMFWEFSEYILDLIFLSDHMNARKTGVNDTMTDLIIGTVGSLMILTYKFRKEKNRSS